MKPDMTQIGPADALAMLRWQRAAGVDLAMGETAINRLARAAPATAPAAVRAPNSAAPADSPAATPDAPPDGDPVAAAALARAAGTLAALEAGMRAFTGCALSKRATQLVFADGNPEAEIMLIGEAPGRDEDLQGKPFVGRSGQLLDRMLMAIGLDRTKVYIANTVPWRPPGNRTPTPGEIATCLPFITRQVELVAPRVIVTLGAAATQTIFDETLSILKTRGRWRTLTIGGHEVRVLPTLHPAYLLRQPAHKALVWRDLLALKAALADAGPGR